MMLILPALAGCPGKDESAKPDESLPFAGQEIRIGVPADRGFRTAWEAPLNEWAAQTGAKYTLTELPARDSSEAFTALAGDDHQTLAIFPLEQAGELLGAGSLAVIPPSVLGDRENDVAWHDLFAGLSKKLAARKETALFVPLSCPVLVCYYRRDLLEDAGLSPPQTWDDYQHLLDNLGNWAPGLTAVEPWGASFRATVFLARAVSLAQHPGHYSLFFDYETGVPLIDSPSFVRALEMSRAAVAKMPPAVLSYSPSDCRDAILGGQAALAVALESPPAAHLSDESGAEAAIARGDGMKLGFVRLPGSRETWNPTRRVWEPVARKGIQQVTLCGFAGLAVAASSRNSTVQTEAAWNALARVGGRNLVSAFPAGITGLCRESQLSVAADAVGPGLEETEAEAYAEAVATSLRDVRLVAELPVIGRIELREVLAQAVARALDGSQTAERSLQRAAEEWREIIARIGIDKVRDNYRASLGLSPLAGKN